MKLKHYPFFIITLFVFLLVAAAGMAETDIDAFRSCSQCGMDRKAYGYSRTLVIYENGSRAGLCSLHCAVIEMEGHKEHTVKSLLVADRTSRELVAADKAFWVTGGSKRGVMTRNPKWAFATPEAAQAFLAAHGGKSADWETVLLATRKEATASGN